MRGGGRRACRSPPSKPATAALAQHPLPVHRSPIARACVCVCVRAFVRVRVFLMLLLFFLLLPETPLPLVCVCACVCACVLLLLLANRRCVWLSVGLCLSVCLSVLFLMLSFLLPPETPLVDACGSRTVAPPAPARSRDAAPGMCACVRVCVRACV